MQAAPGTKRGMVVRTPWRSSCQLTSLPQPPSVPSGSSGGQGSGDWRGALQAGRCPGRQEGRRKERLGPTVPLPQPSTPPAPIRVPEMLGRTPGPPLPGASARPVPSYFLFYWPLWPGPSQPQTSVTWDSQGSRWPLQGAAGEAGDAAAARSHSQRSGD